MDKISLGKLIKQRRVILNITQKDLAEISAIALRKLIDIENGKANPTIDTLSKVLNALGLTIDIKVR
jgi:transcriptional regulator with XRE-family HTH domain